MLRSSLAFAILLLTLTACRDEFVLEAPLADIPVIYAYLDAGAEDNFLRVERVFAEIGGDANDLARNVDSLYYGPEAATVSITSGGQTVDLERVNGDDFGIEREEGVFAESPNILYRLSDSDLDLMEGNNATVRVSTDRGITAEATTVLLPELDIRNPDPDNGINPRDYARNTTFRWFIDGTARVFDIRLYFNLREFSISNPGEVVEKRLEWVVNSSLIRPNDGNANTFLVNNESIWQFLGNQLEVDNDVQRIFDGFDVQISAAGSEVEELIELANANSGITSAQAAPVYTNVENGLGIVTSRVTTLIENVPLNSQSREELRNGTYTGDLNFQ